MPALPRASGGGLPQPGKGKEEGGARGAGVGADAPTHESKANLRQEGVPGVGGTGRLVPTTKAGFCEYLMEEWIAVRVLLEKPLFRFDSLANALLLVVLLPLLGGF